VHRLGLLRTPAGLAALAAAVLYLIFYATPILGEARLQWFAGSVAHPLLLALVVFSLAGAERGGTLEEHRFWGWMRAAFGAWFLVGFLGMAVTEEGFASRALRDALNVLSFGLMALALEERPHWPAGWAKLAPTKRLSAIGTITFLAALWTYFVLIPSVTNPAEYETRVPSFYLFVILDVLFLARLAALVRASSSSRWRGIYSGWMAIFGLWFVGDLVDCLSRQGLYELRVGTALDLLYYLPLFGVMILGGAARHSVREEVLPAPEPVVRRGFSTVLFLYAILLPLQHFLLDTLGLLDEQSHQAREVALLVFLVALLALVFFEQRLLAKRNRELESKLTVLVTNEEMLKAQKMEALGSLAAGVAHDFNNWLTVISTSRGQAARKARRSEAIDAELSEIQAAVEHASVMTSELLTFSKQEVGSAKVLDLAGELRKTSGLLRRIVGHQIDLELRLADDLWPARVDPGQFTQVLLNLTINARDAMPDGGLLVFEAKNETLASTGHGCPRGDYVVLSASDTGRGMEPEQRHRAFDPFFTTKPKGAGLGLATVHGIVRQSGGSITVHSHAHRGTTFRIALPRAVASEAEPQRAPSPPSPPSPPGNGLTEERAPRPPTA